MAHHQLDQLVTWFEGLCWATEGRRAVTDARGVPRVGHLLLRRL